LNSLPRGATIPTMLGRTVASFLIASAFVVTPSAPSAPKAGGTFLVDESATYIDSIDAAQATLAGDLSFLSAACASLFVLPDKPLGAGYRPIPDLATAFPRISRDGKTYVFKIRSGLRFNTGAPVTAADVAFTINRILSPTLKSPSTQVLEEIVGAADVIAGKAKTASGITASGNRLTIRLVHADGGFVDVVGTSLCALPTGLPIEPGGVTAPVPSAAPYYISEYVPAQRLVLTRNSFYRGSRPHHVDRFVFDLAVDDSQALNDTVNGKADYAWVPNLSYAPRAAEFVHRFGVNKQRFFIKPGTFERMFVLNTSRPLFRGNAPLRRAINFAIDRPALIGQIALFSGSPVDHYVMPFMPGYRRTHVYPLHKPDVRRARALAKGHTRSGKLVLYVPTRPGVAAQAQIVKQDLKAIGLNVQIDTFPGGPGYFQRLANRREPFDMGWIGWQDPIPDPGSFLDGLFDGRSIGKLANQDYSYFNSPKWNRALSRALRLTGNARYRAFGRLDIDLARQEAPAVAFSVDNAISLVSSRTRCVVANPYLDLAAVCLK
jgi:ABC-type transport system substrate-binding protein